eukprot:2193696-Prymnesium_polylepis.1
MVEFKQRDCDVNLFHMAGPVQLIMRRTSFSPLSPCSAAALAEPTRVADVTPLRCSETYVPNNNQRYGVCTTSASCVEVPMEGLALSSLNCSCFDPTDPLRAFPNPEYPDEELSPYLPMSGCSEPMAMDQLLVISNEVAVALEKPDRPAQTVNVTLRMQGTDVGRPANWTIMNATLLPDWLRVPTVTAQTDANAIAAGLTDFPIALILNSTTLRERAGPYVETMRIIVHSAILEVTREEALRVSLTVEARTSFFVWGKVAPGYGTAKIFVAAEYCNATNITTLGTAVAVDEERRLPFTACDSDWLPVDHQLPSQVDARSVSLTLISNRHPTPVVVNLSLIHISEPTRRS